MDLIEQTYSILEQAEFYLTRIDSQDYKKPIPILSDSFIGQHTRHFIEFYQCLLQQTSSGQVNYDDRKRDYQLENSPEFAVTCIQKIKSEIEAFDFEKQLTLQTCNSEEEPIPTNYARELLYNIEHTIHHLALIKVGILSVCPTMELPRTFGFAPSTVKHLESCNQEG